MHASIPLMHIIHSEFRMNRMLVVALLVVSALCCNVAEAQISVWPIGMYKYAVVEVVCGGTGTEGVQVTVSSKGKSTNLGTCQQAMTQSGGVMQSEKWFKVLAPDPTCEKPSLCGPTEAVVVWFNIRSSGSPPRRPIILRVAFSFTTLNSLKLIHDAMPGGNPVVLPLMIALTKNSNGFRQFDIYANGRLVRSSTRFS